MNNFLKIVGAIAAIFGGAILFEAFFAFNIEYVARCLFQMGTGFALWYVASLREENEIIKEKFNKLKTQVSQIQEQQTGIKKSVAEKEIERLQELKNKI
jgi:hypothetical protein